MRPATFLMAAAGLVALVWTARGAAAEPAGVTDGRIPVPTEYRVSLELDRDDYLMGENVLVHFRVRNNGTSPFSVDTGGDYRGAPRHTRFNVTATAAQDGKPAPDPYPNAQHMGGLGGGSEVLPGQAFEQSVPIMRYVHIPSPGEYVIRISHDLGWAHPPDVPAAVAEARIIFRMPTPQEAEQVVATMLALPGDAGVPPGERRADFPDLSILRYPVYLPMLRREVNFAPAAQGRHDQALEAIARMPDAQALEMLLKMTEQTADAGGDIAVVRLAQALGHHLPATADAKKYKLDRRFPSELSWDEKFAPRARALALKMLGSESNQTVAGGAALLGRVGQKQHLAEVVAAIDRVLPGTIDEPRRDYLFSETRNTLASLGHVARELMIRAGAVAPADPKTPGEVVTYLGWLATAEPRPAEAQERVAAWTEHSIPYVREMALGAMPPPLPAEVRDRLPALIQDADINVRLAAARAAQRAKESSANAALLRRLAEAPSTWEIDAMGYALAETGGQFEAWQALAGRLDEAKLTCKLLVQLSKVVDEAGGNSWRDKLPAGEPERLKKRWTAWLGEHETELRDGKRFKVGEPALTRDLFPPEFSVSTPQGDWPPRAQ